MSQSLTTIEQVLRPVISAAFKSLETKTYDTNREDYMDVLLEDLFTILFPKKEALTTTTTPLPTPTTTQSPPKLAATTPESPKKEEKKKPGPKPKVNENGEPVNKPRNRSPKPEEEKKKPGPKPKESKTEGEGEVAPPKEKKKPGPKPKVNENGEPVNKPKSPPQLPPSPVNIAKVDPTIRKKLKETAKQLKVTYEKEQDEAFLTWVNTLTPEEFKEMGDEYPKRYFQKDTTPPPPSPENPPQPPKAKEQEEESELVEAFGEKGESYWVDKQTGRIYEGEGEVDKETGAYANYKPLGYAGEGPFKNIKV